MEKKEVDLDGDGTPDIEEDVMVAKGLDQPKRPTQLQYTSSEGSTSESGSGTSGGAANAGSNRAERRAAQKRSRKR